MKVIAACLLVFMTLQSLYAQDREPIIDMHLHAYPVGHFWPAGAPNPATGYPSPETDEELFLQTRAAMDRHNIVLAVTSGYPYEVVLDWNKKEPERIIPSPYIGGSRGYWPDIDSLRQFHQDGQLGAIGELGLQYQGLTLSSQQAEPYLSLAEDLDVPVGVHLGPSPPGATYDCCPDFRAAHANPLLIEDALARYPDIQVYIMHAGYPYINETIALLHAHPQVYADLAVINWVIPRNEFQTYLKRLVRAGFHDRLMFGSDQMFWPETIETAIESIESADFLTDEQKRDIFYNNAARFLRLSDEELARHHGM
jgi:uncharacterized protein